MTKNDDGLLLFRIIAGMKTAAGVFQVLGAVFIIVLIVRIIRYVFTGC
jgi:hypothetical protein